MSAHQCTMREAAALLGCTAQSLSAFFDRVPEARQAWEFVFSLCSRPETAHTIIGCAPCGGAMGHLFGT
jgi:hypothetical protein